MLKLSNRFKVKEKSHFSLLFDKSPNYFFVGVGWWMGMCVEEGGCGGGATMCMLLSISAWHMSD